VAAEAEHKPLFMVLDPEGTIIRVADDESQYDNVVAVHVVDRLKRELPAGVGRETHARMLAERLMTIITRYKMVRL